MNGNIALSMEIGSAYALQVCLLQIPALVLYSAMYGRYIDLEKVIDHTFSESRTICHAILIAVPC
jgi:Ca2+:H+ antiporter